MVKDIDWSKSHCGVYRTPIDEVEKLMPEVKPVLDTFPMHGSEWTVDIKVHMLMPNQYPCIPNWHFDNIPRNDENKQDFSKVKLDKYMYLWLSGAPYTEFMGADKSTRLVPARTWIKFTQANLHRGTMAKNHGWRAFVRACPFEILKPATSDKWLRRHSQVYLNTETFTW